MVLRTYTPRACIKQGAGFGPAQPMCRALSLASLGAIEQASRARGARRRSSLVMKPCRQKSTFPGPLWKQFPEKNRRTALFGGLHAKPVTSLLRTLRAYARSQGFWLQAAAASGSSEERDISEWGRSTGTSCHLSGVYPTRSTGACQTRAPNAGALGPIAHDRARSR